MVHSRRPTGGRRLAASHQRSWLWGRHAVLETLRAGRWPVLELRIADDDAMECAGELIQLADMRGVSVSADPSERLTQLCGTSDHQGLLARMAEFPLAGDQEWNFFLQQLECQQSAGDQAPGEQQRRLIVVCDRIQDPHNFGAILRCCDGGGVDAVVVDASAQAAITPHVFRSSAGAVNYLTIFRVGDLVRAVSSLIAAGLCVAGASERSDVSLWQADLTGEMSDGTGVALIIGSEGFGIRPELLDLCAVRAAIPMQGRVHSLNAAVAAGILIYEIRRQQHACRQ